MTLAQKPRPLDDFWADLTRRTSAVRSVDGPVVAEVPFEAGPPSHKLAVIQSGGVLEISVDDQAMTHRIGRATPH